MDSRVRGVLPSVCGHAVVAKRVINALRTTVDCLTCCCLLLNLSKDNPMCFKLIIVLCSLIQIIKLLVSCVCGRINKSVVSVLGRKSICVCCGHFVLKWVKWK